MIPDLSRLSLRDDPRPPTGGDAGREVEAMPDLRSMILDARLASITTVEEACKVLVAGGAERLKSVDRTLHDELQQALRGARGEAFAERLMRADMNFAAEDTLPLGAPFPYIYSSWRALLSATCYALRRWRDNGDWINEFICPRSRAVILAGIPRTGLSLARAAFWLQDNEEVVLAAVQQDGNALQYASPRMRMNVDIVVAAVLANWPAYLWADPETRRSREVVKAICSRFGGYLSTDERFKDDREVVLEAVRNNGYALEHASGRLQQDREVVLEAVRENGLALKYASLRSRRDREIMMAAVSQDGLALEWAISPMVPALTAEEQYFAEEDWRQIVVAAVRNNPGAIDFAGDLKEDTEVLWEAGRMANP